MPLSLSDADLRRLAAVMRVLVGPSGFPSLTAWRREIGIATQRLLESDGSAVLLQGTGGPELVAMGQWEGGASRALADYLEAHHHINRGEHRRIALDLATWVRSQIWDRADLERSSYFNEWCVPNRNLDSVGMRAVVPERFGGELCLMATSVTANRFDPDGREAALLGLLQPALAAGTQAALLALSWRYDLGRQLDHLDAPLVLCAASGRVVHATPQLLQLMQDLPDGGRLLAHAGRLAAEVSSLANRRRQASDPPPCPSRTIASPRGPYVLRGTILEGAELAGIGPLILVAVTLPSRAGPPDAAGLQSRYALTPREAEVALLLRRGNPNRAVAAALGVTEHTARRHTERVLAKLGVTSRAAVASVLAGDAGDASPPPALRPPAVRLRPGSR
jgi:DNA-binding CsgD family transcriptional regulator